MYPEQDVEVRRLHEKLATSPHWFITGVDGHLHELIGDVRTYGRGNFLASFATPRSHSKHNQLDFVFRCPTDWPDVTKIDRWQLVPYHVATAMRIHGWTFVTASEKDTTPC